MASTRTSADTTTTPTLQSYTDGKWLNATITRVDINIERGFASPTITLDGCGWGTNFGGVSVAYGASDWFYGTMCCAGTEHWCAMVGRNVRVFSRGIGSMIYVMAHIVNDHTVFDQQEWAKSLKAF